jgi:inner membrane protein
MFNSTHTFVGLIIARTGAEKWAPYATATAVIASNLPDMDSIAGFWGPAAYLDHHRGITHTIVGVLILALLLAAIVQFFSGKFWSTYAIALIAMATHPALDYLNPYGLRPLLPWDGTWYYGDSLFILDPYLDAVLLSGIVWGALKPDRRRISAVVCGLVALSYIGARLQLHAIASSRARDFSRAERHRDSVQPEQMLFGAAQWAALPDIWDPFTWEVIVETNTGLVRFPIDVLHRPGAARNELSQMPSAPWSAAAKQASTAPSAAALLRFARFPVLQVDGSASGYRVRFFDFRFYREATGTALGSEVKLDSSLHVLEDNLSFSLKVD